MDWGLGIVLELRLGLDAWAVMGSPSSRNPLELGASAVDVTRAEILAGVSVIVVLEVPLTSEFGLVHLIVWFLEVGEFGF